MEGESEITVRELKRLIDSGTQVRLVDVREQYEYDFCHIEGSTLIPMRKFWTGVNDLNPEDEYVFYCHVGERSAWVVNLLRHRGFKKVKNLKGGIDQWAVEIDPSTPRY
ncbi:MAG: rhodanese-like domain-containing protein [Candidatus Bathyarchaeia archaeon]|jgi:adenylyltransferase/sulfurtransferase